MIIWMIVVPWSGGSLAVFVGRGAQLFVRIILDGARNYYNLPGLRLHTQWWSGAHLYCGAEPQQLPPGQEGRKSCKDSIIERHRDTSRTFCENWDMNHDWQGLRAVKWEVCCCFYCNECIKHQMLRVSFTDECVRWCRHYTKYLPQPADTNIIHSGHWRRGGSFQTGVSPALLLASSTVCPTNISDVFRGLCWTTAERKKIKNRECSQPTPRQSSWGLYDNVDEEGV